MAKPIVIANENGDWWEHKPGEKLYVLDLNQMDPEQIADLEDELDIPNGKIEQEMMNQDKLHKVIWDYGYEITTPVDNSRVEELVEYINHLQAVIRELQFAKKGE
jgi:hypothetical protein